jgi:hypothetical protein
MASGDVLPKRLGGPTQLGTSTTTLTTVSSGHQYSVKQVIICNTHTSQVTVSLAIGTAATVANRFVSGLVLEAGSVTVLDTALILEATETVQGLASTASVVNIILTGWDREL